MSSTSIQRPVTRIRGEVTPRPELTTAVRRFFDPEAQDAKVDFYTAAQVFTPTREYHLHAYDRQVSEAEKVARSLAMRVFQLDRLVRLQNAGHGVARLVLGARSEDESKLYDFRMALNRIPSQEDLVLEDTICAEFAVSALGGNVKDRERRIRQAAVALQDDLAIQRPPSLITVSGLQVVTKDTIRSYVTSALEEDAV